MGPDRAFLLFWFFLASSEGVLVVGHLFSEEIAVEVVQALVEQDVGDRLGLRINDFFYGIQWCAVL